MRKEYEELDGRKFAILWRKKGNKTTNKCPFCGIKHVHGTSEGHRIRHCGQWVDKRGEVHSYRGFYAKDGTYLTNENGYILQEY